MSGRLRTLYEITLQLVLKDLRGKYKGTWLGYLWALGTPLFMAIVLDIAFRRIVRIQVENYALFLITGLFTWQWFNISVNGGARCFLDNASLIKKVIFPRYLVPASHTLVEGFHFVMALPVIMILLAYHGLPWLRLGWIYQFPLLLTLHFMISCGAALVAASLNTLFRDMERVIALGTTLLFYMTPVIYPMKMIPPDLLPYFQLNPMTNLITLWRDAMLTGHVDWSLLPNTIVTAIATFLIGGIIYRLLTPRFAEVL